MLVTKSQTYYLNSSFLHPRQSWKHGWQISKQMQNQFKPFTRRETFLKMPKQIIFSMKHTQVGSRIHEAIVSGRQERTEICTWIHGMIANTIFSTWASDCRKDCTIWCSINNAKQRCKSCTSAQHESNYEFVKYEYKSVNLCILLIKWWLFDDSFTPISIRLSIIRFGAPRSSTKIHTSSKIFVLRLFAGCEKKCKVKMESGQWKTIPRDKISWKFENWVKREKLRSN